MTEKLKQLFFKWSGEEPAEINPLPLAGSNRKYWRIISQNHHAIGTYGDDEKENRAFIEFSNHFNNAGIAVPEIFAIDLENKIYLQEDLGDTSLFDLLTANKNQPITEEIKCHYQSALKELVNMQVIGGKNLDYSACYPTREFNHQSTR